MASGFTNRGKAILLDSFFRNNGTPASFEVHLVTSATAPTADTNVLSDLTEIADGNGYAQSTGFALARNTTDWDAPTEDDTGDLGKILAKDITWTASGGPLPASGNGARYAVLTTPEAGAGNKKVLAYWDLVADRSVSVGQPLTLTDAELRLTE